MDKIIYIGILISMFFITEAFCQEIEEWTVPEEKSTKLSTVEFTDSVQKLGLEIYNTNCKSCHGDPGKSNYINLNPSPGDPASEKIQKNTDGEIYFKVSEGRGQMPSFKNVLSSIEIWSTIAFIRSFNNNYIQKLAEEIAREGFKGGNVRIILEFLAEIKQIKAKVTAEKEGKQDLIAATEVKLFAKRYFGNLQIDETKETNTKGIATFQVPEGLPGDSLGNIGFIAQLVDEENFGLVQEDTLLQAGLATHNESLTADRAMWNTLRMAPWWLIITYTGGVLLVWGMIFIVMLELKKIKAIGDKNKDEETKTMG